MRLQYDLVIRRGYGGIGRRYGLDQVEPWYGDLPSDGFQIQGTLGHLEWAILSQIRFTEAIVFLTRKEKDRCRDSMEAILTNEYSFTQCRVYGIIYTFTLQKREWVYAIKQSS